MLKKKINLAPELPYLGIFGIEFQETIALFEISTLKFDKMLSFL